MWLFQVLSRLLPRDARLRFCAVVVCISILQQLPLAAAQVPPVPTIPFNSIHKDISTQWLFALPQIEIQLHTKLSKPNRTANDLYYLYTLQANTLNLINYSREVKDRLLVQQLTTLYLYPYTFLESRPGGYSTWVYYAAGGSEPIDDYVLVQGQFLNGVSHLLRLLSEIPDAERTAEQKLFIERYTPVLTEHLCRWLYNKNPDSPSFCTMSESSQVGYYWVVRKKLVRGYASPDWANALSDKEMIFADAALNLLQASQNDSANITVPTQYRQSIQEFMTVMGGFLESRLAMSTATSFSGVTTPVAYFDPGSWSAYPNYQFAGYSGTEPPTEANRSRSDRVGFDVGHNRRIVPLLLNYFRNKDITHLSFPSVEVMRAVSNNIPYALFNKNFEEPLFASFSDGSNGWFGDITNPNDPSLPPGMLSRHILIGGYGFLASFSDDLKKVLGNLYVLLNNHSDSPSQFLRTFYSGILFDPISKSQFLPSLLELTDFRSEVPPPQNLELEFVNLNQRKISWRYIPRMCDGFVIYQSVDGGPFRERKRLSCKAALYSVLMNRPDNVGRDGLVRYRVTAYKRSVSNEPEADNSSSLVSTRYLAGHVLNITVGSPTKLKLKSNLLGQVTLRWISPKFKDRIANLVLERKGVQEPYTVIGEIPKDTTEFVDTAVRPDARYTYRLRSSRTASGLGEIKYSAYSNSVSLRTKDAS